MPELLLLYHLGRRPEFHVMLAQWDGSRSWIHDDLTTPGCYRGLARWPAFAFVLFPSSLLSSILRCSLFFLPYFLYPTGGFPPASFSSYLV